MKTNKLLYGLLAFGPLIIIFFMFVLMFMMIGEIINHPHDYAGREPMDMPYYGAMMMVAVVAGIVGLAGMVTYILHCMNNMHIPQDKRTMWIVILALFGTIGMMIYFFTWIRKEDQLNEKHASPFGN